MDSSKVFSRRQLGGLLAGGVVAAASVTTAFAQSSSATPVPVTGDSAFDILINDHKRIAGHIKRLISDTDNRRDTLMALSTLFTVHNITEENFVYPAVAKIAMLPNDADMLFHQQDEAKSVVWTLHDIGKTHGYESEHFTNTAEALLNAALAHVHLEETRDFPKLAAALGTTGVITLTHEVRMFRQRFS